MTLKVGIGTFSGQVGQGHAPADAYADLLSLARRAEEADFDAIWISSHHGVLNAHVPSPLILLAGIAAATERIVLGTAIVVAPLQHPLRFAEDCAVLDQLSRGRLIVGLGAGWREAEFDSFGIDFSERGRRTTELAEICRAAWGGERFSFEGRYHQYRDALVTPAPYAPLRLFLGGTAPPALKRAGRLADGFIATGTPQAGLPALITQVSAVDDAVRSADRDPRQVAIGFQANLWVSRDGSVPMHVKEAMWNQIGAYVNWHAGTDGRQLAPMDESDIRRRAFIGTPAEIVEQVRPWIEAFPERELHLLFRLHYPGLAYPEVEDAISLFGREVTPELRRLHGGAEHRSKVLSA
jgi:probable F420-dependent oxidoreductase